MSKLTVRSIKLASGERIALLTHGSLGLPVIPVVHYVLDRYRQAGRSPATMRQGLRAVALGLDLFCRLNIDLVERAAQLRFLSRPELIALADLCRTSIPELGSRPVDPRYSVTRYFTCIDYVKWVAEPVIGRVTGAREHAAALEALNRFEKRARRLAPPSDVASGHMPGERLGMTPEQRELFLRVIRPGELENPFKPELQIRNAALLILAYDLGPRAGELLGLKCVDIDFGVNPASVTFHRRHDDPDDSRPNPASTKTHGRILLLDDDLRDLLDRWISDGRSDRTLFPEARRHPYVFVNHRGGQLSDRGLRLIVSTLSKHYPSLGRFFPHLLRHDWNDRWNETNAESGNEAADIRDQKYAMGWSANSKMPLRYGKRSIRNSTNKKISKMQQSAMHRDGK
ncbi:site-specific integrase [Paraburkholderia sp. Ac-20342]|uniref:site-specific integrase n=1 Tax=Paraburkholderia sp. Ac-20342 TaxID=2703889 RepID=UPI00197D7B17|nr:site-specific integrase [Paraburkholderia sp. Ac-20342]MBN3850715.1 site-specific integrase [Paraburkholderia sp. Ac-20342]